MNRFCITGLAAALFGGTLSAQNVGVGTAAPTANLHISGTFRYQHASANSNYVLRAIDAAGNADWVDVNTLVTAPTHNTLDMSYDEGGAGAGRVISAMDGAVSVQGQDGFEVTGTFGSGLTIGTPGAGTRMFFNPRKAAFRAGRANATEWDNANVGDYSTAIGFNQTASGQYAVALGRINTASNLAATAIGSNNTASGLRSVALGSDNTSSGGYSTTSGYNNTASQIYSVALGFSNDALGNTSTAFGGNTDATGSRSTAFGNSTLASGANSTAMGISTIASGPGSTALGGTTTASGDYSTAIGRFSDATGEYAFASGNASLASGDRSTALGNVTVASGQYSTSMGSISTASGNISTSMGWNTLAQAYLDVALGRFNVGGGTAASWTVTEPIFEIGIGASAATRANALTVLKSGNVGIGPSSPINLLDVAGGVAVGSAYAGLSNAPNDGLIVENNVGVGTASPAIIAGSERYLTISASNTYVASRTASLELQGSSTSNTVPIGQIDFSSVFPTGTSNNIARIEALPGATSADGQLAISTGAGGTLSEVIRIDEWGSVGIGAPPIGLGLLEVNGTINTFGFRMPPGAVANYVLSCNPAGTAFWRDPALLPHNTLDMAYDQGPAPGNGRIITADGGDVLIQGVDGLALDHNPTSNAEHRAIDVDADNTGNFNLSTYGVYSDARKDGASSDGNTVGGLFVGNDYQQGSGTRLTVGVGGWAYTDHTNGTSSSYGVWGIHTGNADNNYAGYFVGDVFTSGAYIVSDVMLKKDITPYSEGLNTIMQLQPVQYAHKSEYDFMNLPSGRQVGLVAQDVEGTVPGLVKNTTHHPLKVPVEQARSMDLEYTMSADNQTAVIGDVVEFKAINYTGLIPVLVQAIQDQQDQIEELHALIQEMRNENE